MKKLASLFTLLIIAIVPANAQDTPGPRAVDDPRGAIQFIENLALETQTIWSDSKFSAQERSDAFRGLFEQATDINILARGMLGRHYRTINTEQKRAYMAAMRDYIVAEFDRRMEQIGFKSLEIVGTAPASGKRGHLFVKTQIMRDEGEPIFVDWRVRKKNGKFQIINMDFEGINLMITNRDVFAAKVKKNGVDGLITWLKAQAAPTVTVSSSE